MTATIERTVTDERPAPEAAERKPSPAPGQSATTRGAKPAGIDRLPFQKKVNLLSDRGLWPQLEGLAKRHGWHSPEMQAFIDANLPKLPCPICGTLFYVYSRRVKYCSDRCRRAAAAKHEGSAVAQAEPASAAEAKQPQVPLQPVPRAKPTGDLCVRLERRNSDGSDRRFYLLLVVQDLFGAVTLIRRWGRDEREPRQRPGQKVVTAFDSLEHALEQSEKYKEMCLKRGYRLVAVERGPINPRDLG